jgi:hypothetical protein
MRAADDVGVTFVNVIVGRGSFNGVVNLSFGVFNWTPTEQGTIDPDPAVACRLRMDKQCAIQLRDNMIDLLKSMEEAEANAAMGAKAPEKDEILAKEKIN